MNFRKENQHIVESCWRVIFNCSDVRNRGLNATNIIKSRKPEAFLYLSLDYLWLGELFVFLMPAGAAVAAAPPGELTGAVASS